MLPKKLSIALIGLMGATVGPWAAAAPASSEAQAQIAFLTAYYKGYIAHLGKGQAAWVAATPFYSASTRALLASNVLACKTLSRGDDMCGYSVDGDPILSTQETAPGLTFARTGFSASPAGPDTIDVSFNVWPEHGAAYQRMLRYVLVREHGKWRVDDATPGDRKGFEPRYALRQQTTEENARLVAQARDVNEAVIWLSGYAQAQQADRFARFIATPLTVCEAQAPCRMLEQGAGLAPLMDQLNTRYFTKGRHDPPLASPPDPKEGSVFSTGPLAFTFRRGMWWLNKVDWRGSAAP